MGWIYTCSAFVALLLIAAAPFMSAPVTQFVSALGVLLLCGARAAVAFFRAAQIRARELFGFWAWVRGHETGMQTGVEVVKEGRR